MTVFKPQNVKYLDLFICQTLLSKVAYSAFNLYMLSVCLSVCSLSIKPIILKLLAPCFTVTRQAAETMFQSEEINWIGSLSVFSHCVITLA